MWRSRKFLSFRNGGQGAGALLAWLLLLAWCHAGALLAQSHPPGYLSGRVQDGAGAPVARATVRLRLAAAAPPVAVVAHTDASGHFQFSSLRPGRYRLRVSKPGYAPAAAAALVGAQAPVTLRLVLNPVGAPAGAIQNKTVENTPLNGRDWTQLATLQAGVTGVSGENSGTGHSAQNGFGAALSISGARPEENDYTLDGISISDYSNGAPGSVVGTTLGVDAVQQMKVLDSNYPAAVGRTAGGVISAATRSGGPAWHGSLYEFLRNSTLDARNFFDKGSVPPFRRNQFGASLGGGLGRFRLFGDFEALRQSLGITTVDTVPTAAARQGQLSTGTVAVDPQVARFLQSFYPLPNGPTLSGGDTGVYSFAGQQATNENYFTTRADLVRAHDTISAIYLLDRSQSHQPDAFDNLISTVVSHRQMFVLEDHHDWGPAASNAVRFGFSRATAVDGGVLQVMNPLLTDPAYGMIPGQFVGKVSVAGMTGFPGGPSAIFGTLSSSKSFTWNSFQGYDDMTMLAGGNTLQFGAMFERMQDNAATVADSNGGFSFSSLSAFLTNQPFNFTGAEPLPISVFGLRQTLFAVYAQDAFRLAPRLRVNLGLRYEITTVPTEAHNRLANLLQLTDTVEHLGNPFFLNPTLHNLEPRVGLAWQPFSRASTLVHSGFAIFDILPLPYLFNVIVPVTNPYFKQLASRSLPPGTFPTGAYNTLSLTAGSVQRSTYVEHNPHRSYDLQWNLSVEQPLSSALALTVGYVGSRSIHLPFRQDDFDTVIPALTPQGYVFPPAATSQRLNPNFSRINGLMWEADAYYNALQASLTARLGPALQVSASYTWGKSIDTSSASVTSDQYNNSLHNPPWYDLRLNRGLSDFNVAQILVAHFTWQPLAPWASGPLQSLLGHWQLGGVFKAQTGTPFTAEISGDPMGSKLSDVTALPDVRSAPGCSSLTTGNPDAYINTRCLAFPNPANMFGNLGRNTLIGPGLWNLDFSMIKNTPAPWVSADSNLQFRAEFFNILNHPDFAPPLNHLQVFDAVGNPVSGAGLITTTTQPAREIQFALKLIF